MIFALIQDLSPSRSPRLLAGMRPPAQGGRRRVQSRTHSLLVEAVATMAGVAAVCLLG